MTEGAQGRAYWLDLFTGKTWREFLAAGGTVSGFRESRRNSVGRMRPGDYLLGHHDRVHDDHPLELILDLSPVAVPGAEVHYRRRGQLFFRAPSAPRSLALVERGPTVTRHHTYVSQRHAAASVLRLVVLLRDRAR